MNFYPINSHNLSLFNKQFDLVSGVSVPGGSRSGCARLPNPSLPLAHQVTIYILFSILGAPEITANLYRNIVYLYWGGCGICSIYLW